MLNNRPTTRSAFSLIELVIVVVIIGILAAVAIPRLSRGSAGAADSALSGDLAVLRKAIDLYAVEHGGTYPTLANIATQLTQYSDVSGTTSTTKTATAIHGPYLRTVPVLPIGPTGYRNTSTFVDGSSGTPGTTAGAWFYNATTGEIKANTAAGVQDTAGVNYNAY